MKQPILTSLQGRYAAASGMVAIVLLCAAYIGYLQLQDTRSNTTLNIATRAHLLKSSHQVKDAVRQMQQSLATFMVDPGMDLQRNAVHDSLRDARTHADALRRDLDTLGLQDNLRVERLQKTLSTLETEINYLTNVRLDVNRQYPSLARKAMSENETEFSRLIDQSLTDVMQDGMHHNMAAYEALAEARYLWAEMVSTFRLYLANRLGSIDESALLAQEKAISARYDTFSAHLDSMRQTTGAENRATVQKLRETATAWYRDFEKVKVIHHNNTWRADITIYHDIITPSINTAWQLLTELDQTIEQAANNDVSILTGVAENQTRILWSFTALSTLLTVIGYFVFRHMVLRPLSGISRALKAVSEGQSGIELPHGNSSETRDLVDAFVAMQEQVKARQLALQHHAMHDSLTNLANRNYFNEHLDQTIRSSKREQGHLSLLIIDLDHFKEVNDTLGHPVGDLLLIQVGLRLSELLRESDLIARLGGDEFAILLPSATEANSVRIAEKILSTLTKPFVIRGQQFYVGASIGIATYPQHGTTAETLVQHADIAMYMAKKNKTGWAIYLDAANQHSLDRLELMTDLRTALKEGTLELHYQPKINLADGTTEGAEALLRWRHPKHGWIAPDTTISMAEQTGLIHELTDWVLTRAVDQTQAWHQAGMRIGVAVNLSATSLHNDRIITHVQELLRVSGFPPEYLTLEITESAMMADTERAGRILNRLDEMGVHIAVDDYGTGFSSLGYLKRLPVKELKIDKSFVLDMTRDENDAVIVRSTIELAHNLGLRVVAEGVETREIWDILQILGCETAQGYYMSKPLSHQEFEHWMKAPKLLPLLGSEVHGRHRHLLP